MTDEQSFKQFLELCKRVCERMEREGSWPWRESPNPEDLVESDDNPENI
jgi:hypothetical protein